MRIGEIDRKQVRAAFERRFSAARMARDYVELYRAVTSRHPESIKIQPIKSKAYAATTTGAVSDRSTIPNIPADKAAVYSALQHERRAIRRTKNKGSRLIDGHLLGSRGSAAPSMNAP